jgi:hypothetical protein
MPEPSRTTKQVAGKYQGNLGYFRRPNLLRSSRFLFTLLVFVIGVVAIVGFCRSGTDKFYSPGPISLNHASLAENCAACHQVRATELRRFLSPEKVQSAISDTIQHGLSVNAVSSLAARLTRGVSFSDIDLSCLECHAGHDLHQPDASSLLLQVARRQVAIVGVASCSSCHREHVGLARMSLPGSSTCAACHADAQRMASSVGHANVSGALARETAQNLLLTDGAVHFVPPEKHRVRVALFARFEQAHPPFDYEEATLRDPDVLRFNHRRHEARDIPRLPSGQKLDCTYCHKPGSDGVFYQKVSYQQSCETCHSLQFDSNNPELGIPHGNPELARAFLRSLPFQYANLAQKRVEANQLSQQQAKPWVSQQMVALQQRNRTGEDLERAIFFTRDPYKPQGGAAAQARFPGCAYCHEVKSAATGPVITRPVMAERWLAHGRFTHAKHSAVACNDCHHASVSTSTADILMPTKASCVQCHNQQSGIVSECITCHTFHAPSTARQSLQASTGGLKELLLKTGERAAVP